jgi:hypothetical protein
MSEGEYAGDLSPKESWESLARNLNAVLLDMRTPAERTFVGRPELDDLENRPALLSWQRFPSMQVNLDFVDALKSEIIQPDTPVFCFVPVGNTFVPDPQNHRGTVNS